MSSIGLSLSHAAVPLTLRPLLPCPAHKGTGDRTEPTQTVQDSLPIAVSRLAALIPLCGTTERARGLWGLEGQHL